MSRFRITGDSIELDPDWIRKMTPLLKGQPVGLYARISGKSSEGSSLDSQIAVNRRFALACGAYVVAEQQEIITGVFITSRSAFNALLGMAERRELKFIIVDVRDRLGRGDAISVLEFLARQVGAEIVFATQPADLDTYEGAALDATETLVSRIERLNIRRRMNRGRREWTSAGRIFTGRFFPYGYRIKMARDAKGNLIERTLVLYEPEAQIVRKIFEWFVYEDLTTYSIAKRLIESGVPIPEGHKSNRRATMQWHYSTIDRILKNETYAGTWHYGKSNVKKYESGTQVRLRISPHAPEHRIPVQVPAVVSVELWRAAQRVIAQHALGGRPPRKQYLLSGMMRCLKSNANMHGHTARHRNVEYGYYVCPNGTYSARMEKHARCTVKRLRQRELELWVWFVIMELAKHPELIRAEIETRQRETESQQRLIWNALAGLEQQLLRYKRQKSELLDLYLNRDQTTQSLTRDEYETKASQLTAQIAHLEKQMSDLQGSLKTDALTQDEREAAMELLETILIAGERATFQDKRAFLRLVDAQILYDGELIQVTGGVPTQKITRQELHALANGDQSSFRRLQFGLTGDFQPGETGNSIFGDQTHNKDCTPD